MEETIISEKFALSLDQTDELRKDIEADPVATVAINACWKVDPLELCIQRNRVCQTNHVFAHKVELEVKPMTNQKSSGRCWIFAGLNAMRIPFMKSINIDDFEFSQTYLFFWDKIERANFFLNNMIECLKNKEEIDGRLMSYLLSDPIADGGQWDMFVNLTKKYGLMPKKCFPETYCSENTFRIIRLLQTKLREFTRHLKQVLDEDINADLSQLHKKQMQEIFRIVAICLGVPPTKFSWEYYDKQKNYKSIGPITPVEFYEKYVKTVFDPQTKVCIVNDPRETSPYGRTYTVHMLGNMVEGRRIVYNNQPIEMLLKSASESIKNGEAVWFGCDIGKRFASKLGIQDLEIHDYRSVFGVDLNLNLSKGERLLYGDSAMSHAMNLTAVTMNDCEEPVKWRVENSWGDDRGEKGYHVMTSDWFREFVYEVVVDRKFVPEQVLKVLDEKDHIVLPAWDPMGTLARSS